MSSLNSNDSSTAETLGIQGIYVTNIPDILNLAVEVSPKLTPCFVGCTGIGKTPSVKAWAAARGAACFVHNFGHMQAQDVSMCLFAPDGSSFHYLPAEWFLAVNKAASDKETYPGGAVLFLDEVNRAPIDVLNAFFTLTDDRRVHDFTLHPDVLVVAAMNPSSDRHTVNGFEKDPAMRKRLAFVHVHESLPDWLDYAKNAGISDIIRSFLRTQSDSAFYNRALRSSGKVFPTPAAWGKADVVIKAGDRLYGTHGGLHPTTRALLSGILGVEVASSLHTHMLSRGWSPEDVFASGGRTALQLVMDATSADPNDSRLTALREAAAPWLVQRAAKYVADVEEGRVAALDVLEAMNFKQYIEALPPENAQSFFAAVNQVIEATGDADLRWKQVATYYTYCGLDQYMAERIAILSAAE